MSKDTYIVDQESVYSTSNEPKLEKRFGLWTVCGLQFSLICSALAIGTFLSTVIGVGGLPVLIYGFLLAVLFDLIMCYSLAEIASAYPHSAAQVHWTYCLAPENAKTVLSFFVGVLSCAGWIFACVSSTYVTSLFIFSLAIMYHPDYVAEKWHYYLVYAAVLLLGHMLNSYGVKFLKYMTNGLAAFVNVATLFILITLLVKAHPKRSAEYVFKTISNQTGWSSNGLVFFLGLLPPIASICLYDGAAHMTDEIETPEKNVPLVMVLSNSFSALVAFLAAIVYMFCIVNEDNIAAPMGGLPIVQLMYDAFRSEALTTIGILFLVFTFVGSSYLYYCSTSRLVWAFAKSNGLPFGERFFGQVSPRFKTPINALLFTTTICLVIGTMILGSSTALNAVLGSSMVCINLSYIFPIACLIYKSRLSLSARVRFPILDPEVVAAPHKDTPYFSLGCFGLPMNIAAVLWAAFIMVWLNFPIYYPVTTSNMNYACAVLGTTFLVGIGLWFGYSRNHFKHDATLKHI